MCHVVLLLPLLTLPVFWILPFALALLVYGMLVAVSAIIYWQIMQAMRRPVQNGAEGMVGEIGVIIESQEKDLLVCVRSEIWHATCPTYLRKGYRVKAVAVVEHLTLQVQQLEVKSNDVFFDAAPIPSVANRAKSKMAHWRLPSRWVVQFFSWTGGQPGHCGQLPTQEDRGGRRA